MNIVSRFTIAAAFAGVAAVACSSAPDEPVSAGVDIGQVDTKCIKGGITCGVTGGATTGGIGTSGTVSTSSGGGGTTTTSGGASGKVGSSGAFTSSGVLYPDFGETCGTNPYGTPTPPPANARTTGGCDPIDCGKCVTDPQADACVCLNVGYGTLAAITCPVAHPCGIVVRGVARCYDFLPNGECFP